MAITLMYITNRPDVAKIAQDAVLDMVRLASELCNADTRGWLIR